MANLCEFHTSDRGYIPAIGDVDFNNRLIKEPAIYGKEVQRVIGMNRFGPSRVETNSSVLVCRGEEETRGLWAAKVLLCF